MVTYSVRDEIIETVNKLFVYTDQQDWEKLQVEVFTHEVFFDMTSLGGVKEEKTSRSICEEWKKEFTGIDAVNHLAGNYLVHIHDTTATVFAYATATHYKSSATKGTTRDFAGTYDIGLLKQSNGWRIYEFKYKVKYITGNVELI
ncbi:MAG: nuclear transport factor 2 family protein [Bacteroidetes bacterium]|nr:nuclear transport factor 2 family protein [Bacteroidota bacterium]